MQTIDLTRNYLKSYIADGNRDDYENSFPELFRHYYQFWARKDSPIVEIKKDEIQTRKDWVDSFVERLNLKLSEHAIDLGVVKFVYFIGVGSTNGHAFRHNGEFYIWLPLETYTTEKLVQIFATHEIIHALHYHYSPAFYFATRNEQLHLARQLITEGLATYLTREILGGSNQEALWGDFLSASEAAKWWRLCEENEAGLFRLIRENYYRYDHKLDIFYANNPADIYQYRAGYFAGLKLLERFASANNLTALDLLKISREKFELEILALL